MRKRDCQRPDGGGVATRNDRKRSRGADAYSVESDSARVRDAGILCAPHHRSAAASDFDAPPQPDPSASKIAYREVMQAVQSDRIQVTWGRIQQQGKVEYEAIVELAERKRWLEFPETRGRGKVLETFEGFVEKFVGDVAYVTLTSGTGETIQGEYPAAELKAEGIRERRRFKCATVEVGTSVEFVVEPVPDVVHTEAEERRIDAWLRDSLGDDDAPQEG